MKLHLTTGAGYWSSDAPINDENPLRAQTISCYAFAEAGDGELDVRDCGAEALELIRAEAERRGAQLTGHAEVRRASDSRGLVFIAHLLQPGPVI